MVRNCFFMLLLLILGGCQAMRGVHENTFYSERWPSANVEMAASFKYLGEVDSNYPAVDFPQSIIKAKSYLFVESSDNNTVSTVGFVKYEKLPSGLGWNYRICGLVDVIDRSSYEIDGVPYQQIIYTGEMSSDIARMLNNSKLIFSDKYLFLVLGKIFNVRELVCLVYAKPYDANKYFKQGEALTVADCEFIEAFHREIDEKIKICEYVPVQ